MVVAIKTSPDGKGIDITFGDMPPTDTLSVYGAEAYAKGLGPVYENKNLPWPNSSAPLHIDAAGDLGAEKVEGLWVVRSCHNTNCEDHVLADLSPYRDCLLAMALRTRVDGCKVITDWDCHGCGHGLPYVGVLLQALEIAVEKNMARASARLAHALEKICACCGTREKCLDCL